MEKQPKQSDFLTIYSLDLFVKHGVLLETKKDGERAWIENKAFNKLSKEKQEEVFAEIEEEYQNGELLPTTETN